MWTRNDMYRGNRVLIEKKIKIYNYNKNDWKINKRRERDLKEKETKGHEINFMFS